MTHRRSDRLAGGAHRLTPDPHWFVIGPADADCGQRATTRSTSSGSKNYWLRRKGYRPRPTKNAQALVGNSAPARRRNNSAGRPWLLNISPVDSKASITYRRNVSLIKDRPKMA